MLSPLPIVSPENTAFFFDFDGTLSDYAEHDEAVIEKGGFAALSQINTLAGGAIAIVTGRPLAFIDSALSPLRTAIAGLQGAEIRRQPFQETPTEQIGLNDPKAEAIFTRVAAALAPYPELNVVLKESGIVVGYAAKPHLKSIAISALEHSKTTVEAGEPAFALMVAKTNVEMRPLAADKGTAICYFMRDAPFSNRRPFFAGDDAADEAGFDAVNAMDGISVKVGEGATRAKYRVASPAELIRWLERITHTDAHVEASDTAISS